MLKNHVFAGDQFQSHLLYKKFRDHIYSPFYVVADRSLLR